MKSLAIAASVAAFLSVPAFAQSTTDFAIMHFNMDADNQGEIIMTPASEPMMADLSMNTTLAEVLEHFNMDIESMSDLRGTNGVTIIMSDPGAAAEIFARLRAESAEDE